MNATMLKLSDLFNALREVKDKYDWSIDGGNIRCRRKRSRAAGTIEPIMAIIREVTGNNRLRRFRGGLPYPMVSIQVNLTCFVRACRRPGRRGHDPRQRHARVIISKILGLTGEVS